MPCALYLRSSKDRSDVSIDAQRRALSELAKARNERIVAEYADAVFSGKDEDRPGFQRLIAAVRDAGRGWDTLLVLAEETDAPAPIMRRMESLERDRQRLEEVVRANAEDRARRAALRNVSEIEVRRLLVEQAATIEDASRDRLAKLLRGLVERVELEGPAVRIFYRIRRDKLASPRGSDLIPVMTALRLVA